MKKKIAGNRAPIAEDEVFAGRENFEPKIFLLVIVGNSRVLMNQSEIRSCGTNLTLDSPPTSTPSTSSSSSTSSSPFLQGHSPE